MTPCDVFCYGEIGVDNIIQAGGLPSPENAVFPTSDSYHVGGAAANTAIWLGGLGVKVRLAGNYTGCDPYGNLIQARLNSLDTLDQSFVVRQDGVTTPFTRAIVTPDGERSFLIFWYPRTPKSPLTTEMLDSARFLALDLYGGPERLGAARLAHEAGISTAIGDVIWPDHPALPFTSIATNSAPYIRQTFPGVDVRAHARRLQAISRGMVITTDGPHAVYAVDEHGNAWTIEPPAVAVVDATGAGDAFRSGLLYGLSRGYDLPHSLAWAAACGSLKVKHLGAATTLPAFQEIETLANSLRALPER